MSEEIQKMIKKVSELYREFNENLSIFRKEIIEVKEKLKDRNISHNQYLESKLELGALENVYREQECLAKGISLAREELFEK